MIRSWKKRASWCAAALLLLLIGFAVVYTKRSAALDQWIENDAGELSPYANRLVVDGELAGDLPPRDRAVAEAIREGRLVVEISRSEYRENLLGNSAWTKVYLVTSKPGDREVRIEIKLLAKLKKNGGNWEVEDMKQLTLP